MQISLTGMAVFPETDGLDRNADALRVKYSQEDFVGLGRSARYRPGQGAEGGQACLSNARKRFRDMPAVRMLDWMISEVISAYFGITTGRRIPGFTMTICEPLVRSCTNPSASKILTRVFQSMGAIFGGIACDERDRDIHDMVVALFRRAAFDPKPRALEDLFKNAALEA